MAGTVRDLFLAVRVVDRATGPLRRVSNDLRRLQAGGAGGAAAQRSRLTAQNAAMQMQRNQLRSEMTSLQTGAARQKINDKILAQERSVATAAKRTETIGKAITANTAARMQLMANLPVLMRKAEAARQSETGAFGGRTQAEWERIIQRTTMLQSARMREASRLQRDMETAQSARASSVINSERTIAAEEANAIQRLKQKASAYFNLGQAQVANSREITRLNALESAYLSQGNLAKWQSRARVVEHLGHALSLVGLAATAAFGLAARAAANFSTQATLAATQARPPGAPVARTAQISTAIQRVVLRQMREFPAAADEMNKAIYDIFSGTNVQNINRASQLLRIFNMEAVAGGTDLDTMVQAGITLYNNFPKQFANATVAGNKFFAMVRYGRGTATQFAQALNPIIPIAKQAGQSFDDVSTTLAFLSRQSRDVTQNAQGYARVLLLLSRPEVRAGFQKLGISVTDNHGRIRSLLDIVTELRKRVKLTPVEAITFFKSISQSATGRGTAGTIQGQRVWARLVEGVKQYHVVSRQVLKDQNEFTRAFAAQRATPGVQWAVFTNQLRALVIELGTQAIPAFAKIGQYVERAIHWFDSLTPHTKRMIGYFGAFAAVGTLVGGVLLTIIGGVASLILTLRLLMGARGITALEGAAAGGARGLGLLGSEAGFISTRLLLVLGSAGALIYVFHRWPATFHLVISLVKRLVDALGGLQQAFEFLSIGLLVRRLSITRGLFGRLGIDALAATSRLGVLRFALLRLGAIGVITLGIMLIFDSKSRGQVGDFIHGRMGWQQAIDERLVKARNYIQSKLGPLGAPQMQLPSVRREQDAQLNAMQANMERRRRQLALIPVRQEERQMARRLGFDLPQRHPILDRLVATMQRLRRLSAAGGPPGIIGPSNTDAANRYAAALQRVHARLVLIKGATRVQQFKALVETAQQLGATKITPSFQQLFHNLVQARMLANAAQRALQLHPTAENSRKAIAAWNKFFAAQNALQQNATKEQVKAANKVVGGLTTAQKQQLDKQKQDFQSTIDSVQQMYDNLLQQNQNIFGQLFQGPQSALIEFRRSWGVAPRPIDLLKDIRGQVFQFQRFERMLNRLRRRGAPPELISQLQQLGPAALPEIAVLARMQPGQWRAYLAAFKTGQQLIKKQTMKDLNEQLALYRKFGKNVGEAIRRGIADEAPGLRNEIRALVLRMFPSLRPHAAAPHHPANRPPPPQHHHHHHHHHHRTTTHRGGRQFQGSMNGSGTTEHHTHYHDHTNIKVEGNESLSALLAKHRNRLRNRPRYGR